MRWNLNLVQSDEVSEELQDGHLCLEELTSRVVLGPLHWNLGEEERAFLSKYRFLGRSLIELESWVTPRNLHFCRDPIGCSSDNFEAFWAGQTVGRHSAALGVEAFVVLPSPVPGSHCRARGEGVLLPGRAGSSPGAHGPGPHRALLYAKGARLRSAAARGRSSQFPDQVPNRLGPGSGPPNRDNW